MFPLCLQHIKPLWVPLFRLQLKRPEGVGELSLCHVATAYGYTDSSGESVIRLLNLTTYPNGHLL